MKKKKRIGLLLLIVLSVSCSRGYNTGTYEAVGKGRSGDIRVSVVIDSEGKITDIEVLENSENNRMMKQVTDGMTPKMKEKNTAEVDIIAGATESSNGFKEAVKNALDEAR
ncbi:MAG: FMN-binding protein [Gallicola sp.]|nr:FMN-binding protein [Gallicola sp.]